MSRSPRALVESLLQVVASQGGSRNIIAFSGGVDSSLAAAVVHRVFPRASLAVLGRSAALPEAQLAVARQVAAHIGLELREVATAEGLREEYVANRGQACFHCKTELYATLEAVAREASRAAARAQGGGPQGETGVVLFNGTNAEDRTDPTRVGLRAAADFGVASPLDTLTKDEVRSAARHLGLPNWRHAASPCLRSRLALGVLATDDALLRVERAEAFVRGTLDRALRQGSDEIQGSSGEPDGWGVHRNMRVRTLAGGRAVVEVDADLVATSTAALLGDPAATKHVLSLGFKSLELRPFKSGAVSTPPVQAQLQSD